MRDATGLVMNTTTPAGQTPPHEGDTGHGEHERRALRRHTEASHAGIGRGHHAPGKYGWHEVRLSSHDQAGKRPGHAERNHRSQADVQSRNCNEMARARDRETLPLLTRDQVTGTGRNGNQHCRGSGGVRRAMRSRHEAQAERLCWCHRAVMQPAIALAANNIPRRVQLLAEQPGFVIEHARIGTAARRSKAQLEFPDFPKTRHRGRLEPAHAGPRRQPEIVQGLHDHGHARAVYGRKIRDAYDGEHAVAGKSLVQALLDDVLPGHLKYGETENNEGERSSPAHAQRDD